VVHKTSGTGKKRIIPLTDDEKKIIDKYENDGDFVFTPKQARIQQSEVRRANRKTKLYPSHIRRNEQRQTGKQLADCKEHINPREFGKIVKRAVKAALMQGDLDKEWTPYDLRHTAITRFIVKLGHKAAQYLAGHSHSQTTDIYDHGDEEVLFDVIKRR
jgi:integrase